MPKAEQKSDARSLPKTPLALVAMALTIILSGCGTSSDTATPEATTTQAASQSEVPTTTSVPDSEETYEVYLAKWQTAKKAFGVEYVAWMDGCVQEPDDCAGNMAQISTALAAFYAQMTVGDVPNGVKQQNDVYIQELRNGQTLYHAMEQELNSPGAQQNIPSFCENDSDAQQNSSRDNREKTFSECADKWNSRFRNAEKALATAVEQGPQDNA